jgi:hypothetical protein
VGANGLEHTQDSSGNQGDGPESLQKALQIDPAALVEAIAKMDPSERESILKALRGAVD